MRFVLLLTLILAPRWSNASDIEATPSRKPNIIVILADDLGWNDVGFHGGNQIPTPNIDALAFNGLILNNHYVPALCTPSRAAFLTGKHPVHTGMQHLVLLENEPRGLPLSERLMPEYLRDEGYVTRAIGKWHLGFFKNEYLPTNRGFDSHYGYWNGYQDYYSHETQATFENLRGYDMHRDLNTDWSSVGEYSTRVFTREAVRQIRDHDTNKPLFMYMAHLAPHTGNPDTPFQAPNETLARFAYIGDPDRRMYAAMVTELDDSVGEIIQALRKRSMLSNSIVLFLSDNGAPTYGIHSNRGSNWPLRGMKQSPWEGGVRGVAAMWAPWLNHTRRVATQLMHMTDWLPTLISAAGLDPSVLRDKGLDGYDVWTALNLNTTSPRNEVLHNIDEVDQYAALTKGGWKYITGTTQNGRVDSWYGESSRGYSDPEYDASVVLKSKAGSAISSVSVPRPRLSATEVMEIREQAEIKCEKRPSGAENFRCNPLVSPCLFNIIADPCELVDLSAVRPLVAMSLSQALERWRRTAVPAANVPVDSAGNPKFYNNTWVPWMDVQRQIIYAPSNVPDLTTLAAILGGVSVGLLALAAVITKMYLNRKKCDKN
ncbi:arylsulfatase B-like [Cloeon dipterum]|uniref:arylsulfatase B-like n=1 Tax=Cloeon dipterum TaxID=197152 RepID=UPI0032204DEF